MGTQETGVVSEADGRQGGRARARSVGTSAGSKMDARLRPTRADDRRDAPRHHLPCPTCPRTTRRCVLPAATLAACSCESCLLKGLASGSLQDFFSNKVPARPARTRQPVGLQLISFLTPVALPVILGAARLQGLAEGREDQEEGAPRCVCCRRPGAAKRGAAS